MVRIVDASGNTVASYEYDPYGKVISATGTLAEVNPIRYRGYYYDNETGLYYLQSRYYDPAIGRFINADSIVVFGNGFSGSNVYAYCKNNPIILADSEGELPGLAIVGLIALGVALVVGIDHWLSANQPEGGYALEKETTSKGVTKKGLYAEGSGFSVDQNGMTVCDVEVGLFSGSIETEYAKADIFNIFTASAVAEFDWSGIPALDVSAVASIYSNSFEATLPLVIFDVTVTFEGYLGAIGAGIEFDIESGKFKYTDPMLGVGYSYGVDIDLK